MSCFPNLNQVLDEYESLNDRDRQILLESDSDSGRSLEAFVADLFVCRDLIGPALGDPAKIDAAFRQSPHMKPRWDALLDDQPWGQRAIAAALERWPFAAARLLKRRASDLKRRGIEWLWPGRWAFGCVHVLDGDPGRGKSTIAFDIAARLSRGTAMPEAIEPVEEEERRPRREKTEPAAQARDRGSTLACAAGSEIVQPKPLASIILSAEDQSETAIVPRLIAAGADLTRIEIVDEMEIPDDGGSWTRPVLLPDDLPAIEKLIAESKARLLIVDPLTAFIGSDRRGRQIDAHKDQSIRQLFYALRRLAERTGICVVIIRHINKSMIASALRRGLGSIAIAGAARGVMLAAEHPKELNTSALAAVKSNLGPLPPTLLYRVLKGTDGSPRIAWLGDCDFSADDLLVSRNADAPRPTRQRAAQEFLREVLGTNTVLATDVWKQAEERGFSRGTIDRAARELEVERINKGRAWHWRIPVDELGLLPEFG